MISFKSLLKRIALALILNTAFLFSIWIIVLENSRQNSDTRTLFVALALLSIVITNLFLSQVKTDADPGKYIWGEELKMGAYKVIGKTFHGKLKLLVLWDQKNEEEVYTVNVANLLVNGVQWERLRVSETILIGKQRQSRKICILPSETLSASEAVNYIFPNLTPQKT